MLKPTAHDNRHPTYTTNTDTIISISKLAKNNPELANLLLTTELKTSLDNIKSQYGHESNNIGRYIENTEKYYNNISKLIAKESIDVFTQTENFNTSFSELLGERDTSLDWYGQ